ncbi:MAG: hypothetical protein ACREEK_04215 [Bradyrhizobium sp.]
MKLLSMDWWRSKPLTGNRSTIFICAFGAMVPYFVAAHWLNTTFTADPNFVIGPDVVGVKFRLMPPFKKHSDFSVTVERSLFDEVADSDDNNNRSPIELYENGKRLGPAHSKFMDIERLGEGRFSHYRIKRSTFIYWSASDNSDPTTNGRAYWVVNPTPRASR